MCRVHKGPARLEDGQPRMHAVRPCGPLPPIQLLTAQTSKMGGGRVIEVATKAEWDAQMKSAGDKAVSCERVRT